MDLRGSDLDGLNPERWKATAIEAIANALGTRFAGPGADEPLNRELEESFLRFVESARLPRSSSFDGVESLEQAVIGLSPSQSGLLASKIYPRLLSTTTLLRVAHQFSPRFVDWFVRNVQPLNGNEIMESVLRCAGPLETPKRRLFALRIAVTLAPDLGPDKVLSEVRQEARSLFRPRFDE